MGFIGRDRLLELARPMMKTGYGQYLARIAEEHPPGIGA